MSVPGQLADEYSGPLTAVRRLVEHTAYRLALLPGLAGQDTAHHLELIARRLHGVQQDLNTGYRSSQRQVGQPGVAALPPTVRHTTRPSP
ncbi:hypothetical protein ACIF80_30725 [Streptomyces sp. NPDC085927]|uniref:hypothetical protein n=1 Tax=Streptomyces sp. NPDC085927 TaxID=3365738 RepID=UPI0037CCD112